MEIEVQGIDDLKVVNDTCWPLGSTKHLDQMSELKNYVRFYSILMLEVNAGVLFNTNQTIQ